MRAQGQLMAMEQSFHDTIVTFLLPGADPEQLQKYLTTPDKKVPVDVEIKKHGEKRSLTANSYYWLIIGKVARKLKISSTRLHNIMLRDFPSPVIVDGKTVNISIPERDFDKVYELETVHLKPTDEVFYKDGEPYRWYFLLKGSHEMNVQEFSELLDHLIEEAKEQGVETLPPDEIAHMKELMKNDLPSDDSGKPSRTE